MKRYLHILLLAFLGFFQAQKSANKPKTYMDLIKAEYQISVSPANGDRSYAISILLKPKISLYKLRLKQAETIVDLQTTKNNNGTLLAQTWYHQGEQREMPSENSDGTLSSPELKPQINFDFKQDFELLFDLCTRSKIKKTESIKIQLNHLPRNPNEAKPQ